MKPDFPVVDSHVHLYPDAIAPKTVSFLSSKFGNAPAFDGTVASCVEHGGRCSVSLSLNLPVATSPTQVDHINSWAAAVNSGGCGNAGRKVLSLASLHPATADMHLALAGIASTGFAGVKFHPEYQKFGFNDKIMDGCWEEMSSLGLVAYLHAGGERVFEPPYRSSPSEVLKLHKRFPGLKIAAAHLGGFGMWDESEEVLCGQNVYLDLSHTFGWMDTAQIVRMVAKHGARRVLFGSDAPWQDPAAVIEALFSSGIGERDLKAICCGNATELFAIDPDALEA